MVDTSSVITMLQLSVLLTIILLTFVYSIPLIFIRRFRNPLHVFTINVCMAMLCCSSYWFVRYTMTKVNARQFFNANTCSLVFYAQTMCTLQVPLALMVVSIHRLCCVIYHNKIFFKSKRWISMCVGCQWLIGIVISLPIFTPYEKICVMSVWMGYYILIITMVIPVAISVMINITIFKYVQSSTRRIQPLSQVSTTNNNNEQQSKLSRRDRQLLRHMLIMLFVFVAGWGPIYVVLIIITQVSVNSLVIQSLSLLAEISLLYDIMDLFFYSHDLRQYLRTLLLPCYHP